MTYPANASVAAPATAVKAVNAFFIKSPSQLRRSQDEFPIQKEAFDFPAALPAIAQQQSALRAAIAEQFLDLGVDQNNPALTIDDDHRVGSRFQLFFASSALFLRDLSGQRLFGKKRPYLRTAQANPSGCFPATICPTTSRVFKSRTATLSAVLTAT